MSKKKPKFNWDEVVELIVVLKDGRRIPLGGEEVKKIVSALVLVAVHGF